MYPWKVSLEAQFLQGYMFVIFKQFKEYCNLVAAENLHMSLFLR